MKTIFLWFCAILISQNLFSSPVADSIPPVITGITITGPNSADIRLSESAEQIAAEEVNNYLLTGNATHPTYVLRDNANFFLLHLVFTTVFEERVNYEIRITGIRDLYGNSIRDTTATFVLYKPMPYDIIIDEIMADPSPPNALPEAEWIEVRNVSPFEINLSGWRLAKSSSRSGAIGNVMLKPDSFLVICSSGSLAELSSFCSALSVTSFPYLSNEGDLISLVAPDGRTIHAVGYSDQWYQNELKKQGGWSIEMIDIRNPCSGSDNWSASVNVLGATPGRVNSIDAINMDDISPKLIRAFAPDSAHVVLYFNEPMDSISAMNVLHYQIDNGIGHPAAVFPMAPLFDKIILSLQVPIQRNMSYLVTVNSLTDCISNPLSIYNSVMFGLDEAPDSMDLVVNEILFNPKNDGVDYVELYNRSDKIINLKNLHIANLNSSGEIDNIVSLPDDGFLFFPRQHLVFTTNAYMVQRDYVTRHPENIIGIDALPSFNDDEGNVILIGNRGNIIDKLYYKDDWQFKLIADAEGVALERIDYNGVTQNENNWQSASYSSGYGTPGDKNSQIAVKEPFRGNVNVTPAIMSPDNDGNNDYALISYAFPEPGYVAGIVIFDVSGTPVKHLQQKSLCGTSGNFKWDGLNDRNQKVATGQYIIYTEAFNLKGVVKKFKNCITVVGSK